MSLISQIKTNFRLGFSRTRKQRSDLDELKAVVASLQQQLGQLQGGSSHHAGLSLDPPLVWLLITEIAEVGAAGRRLNLVRWGDPTYSAYAEHSKFEIDEDDEQLYLIETDPTMPLVFIGARVLCIPTRLYDQGDYPAKGLYRPIAGEVFGFFARLGDRDELGQYPWVQRGPLPEEVPHPDIYTNETVINGQELGPAVPFDSLAYDPAVLLRYDFSGAVGFMFTDRGLNPGFRFIGSEEPRHGPCEEVVAA